ncbi:MAG: argininosuccinate lyase [Clostridia bacterium]|nr:argininosuccinate lyase [Clostridia bacterium]
MSDKMWAGRFAKALDKEADDFNSSVHFDCKMFRQDIQGSMAHAAMLGAQNIIAKEDSEQIIATLEEILKDIESGTTPIDMDAEDIHMFVEAELTRRIGDVGKRLHTARSRNDQVAVDIRLYLRDEAAEVVDLLKKLLLAITGQASAHKTTIMPGYTHLQRAQPITFAHHLMAYAMMFTRDITRVLDAVERMNYSPLGSCALAGTTYPTNRDMTAKDLGFNGIMLNSIDGVSDRDFCVELMSAFALIMTHLSRFSEEIILWSSWEFKFVELDDSYTTGSSIMPQKKNSDMAELVRGKTGRVYGDLMALLTTLKGIPLAYNKDMQEDKEAIFDSLETVKKCLSIFAPMIETMKPIPANMRKAAQEGFINATDLADYLVKKGLPFRSAYKIVGQIVALCIEKHTVLEELPLAEYQTFSDLFAEDLYEAISLETCTFSRTSAGGPSAKSLDAQLCYVAKFCE